MVLLPSYLTKILPLPSLAAPSARDEDAVRASFAADVELRNPERLRYSGARRGQENGDEEGRYGEAVPGRRFPGRGSIADELYLAREPLGHDDIEAGNADGVRRRAGPRAGRVQRGSGPDRMDPEQWRRT